MDLTKASVSDFQRLKEFYRNAIANTENIAAYAKWVYGRHPDDEMIMSYITEGAMYFCEKDGAIISAAAVTPRQDEDYHGTPWGLPLADDEVAVVHILCVDPKHHKQGIARQTMGLISQLAREMGKHAVRLDALSSNTPARRLYESLGFVLRGQQRWFAENVGWMDFMLYELIMTGNDNR